MSCSRERTKERFEGKLRCTCEGRTTKRGSTEQTNARARTNERTNEEEKKTVLGKYAWCFSRCGCCMHILIIELTCPLTSSKFSAVSIGKKASDVMIDSRLFSRWLVVMIQFLRVHLLLVIQGFSLFPSRSSRVEVCAFALAQINTWKATSNFFHRLVDHWWRRLRSFLPAIVSGDDEEEKKLIILSPSRRLTGEQQESDFSPSFISWQTWRTSVSGPIALGQLNV